MASVILIYCVAMWTLSAWCMWSVYDPQWEELSTLPVWLAELLQLAGTVVIVLAAPIWLPIAFYREWRREG